MPIYEKCAEIMTRLETLLNAVCAVMREQNKAIRKLNSTETQRPLTKAEEAEREKLEDSLEVLGAQADGIDHAICYLSDIPNHKEG